MGRRGRHDGRASERADRVYKRGKKYEARGKMPPIWFINKCGSDSIYLMKEKLIVSIFSGYWMSFSLLGGLECLSIRCLPILTREVNLNYASLSPLSLCVCFYVSPFSHSRNELVVLIRMTTPDRFLSFQTGKGSLMNGFLPWRRRLSHSFHFHFL